MSTAKSIKPKERATVQVKKAVRKSTRTNRMVMLTTARLEEAAGKAFSARSRAAMLTMGYTVVALDGWIVKLFQNGKVRKLRPIIKVQLPKLVRG